MSRRVLRALAYFAAALICLMLAVHSRSELPGAYLTLRWQGESVSYEAVERSIEGAGSPARAAIWQTLRRQSARGLFEADVSVAIYRGDMRLLAGDALISGNPGGCALSLETARALYGGADAAGRDITIEGKSYIVKGVFLYGQADVLIEWDGVSDIMCDKMALAFPGTGRGLWREKALSLLQNAALPQPHEVIDAALMYSIAKMESPRFMIPTRWSDFGGWRRALEGVSQRLGETLRAELSQLDFFMARTALAALIAQAAFAYCIIKAVCGLLSRARPPKPPQCH